MISVYARDRQTGENKFVDEVPSSKLQLALRHASKFGIPNTGN